MRNGKMTGDRVRNRLLFEHPSLPWVRLEFGSSVRSLILTFQKGKKLPELIWWVEVFFESRGLRAIIII